jgi:hypothetical protein
MANTTNFNWETPDDTDLVKDGAAAIRTLGSAIDTSLVDLKGGTTGQVLAKNSNTDMDFIWATDASGIPATIFDAKGDLIVASAADTAARLAVGTNGHILTADSTATNGVKWAAPAAAGGGMTLLSTTTLSGATTTVSSINQGYVNLYVVAKLMTNASAAYNLDIACNGATTSTTFTGFEKNSTSNAGLYTGASQNTELEPTLANGYSQTDANNILVMDIFNYSATDSYKIINLTNHFINSAGTQSTSFYIAGFRDNTAISSIDFKVSGGTFNGGTILVYGVK